jgi:hypothetical protein
MLLLIPRNYSVNTPTLSGDCIRIRFGIGNPYAIRVADTTFGAPDSKGGSRQQLANCSTLGDIKCHFFRLQYAEVTEQANNEIMNVSLQNEPLPSNVSIKSSRYRVTRNLIYHSHKRSPVKARVQKDRVTIV